MAQQGELKVHGARLPVAIADALEWLALTRRVIALTPGNREALEQTMRSLADHADEGTREHYLTILSKPHK